MSSQAIGSIIFQEKTAGPRGAILNEIGKVVKADDNTLSLGLGEMQIRKAAELMGMDTKNITSDQRGEIIKALEDPKQSIELIAMNIVDMQKAVGRELTVGEAAYGHNTGKDNLKKTLENGPVTGNRVSSRSKDYQDQIRNALK